MKGELLDAVMWLRNIGEFDKLAEIIGQALAEAQAKRDAETEWEYTAFSNKQWELEESILPAKGWEPFGVVQSADEEQMSLVLCKRRKKT
jgi:hypothetical protein